VVQAVVAGASMLAILESSRAELASLVAGATLVHLLLVFGDVSLTHATAHARMAAHEITHGEFQGFFRVALALSLFGLATPWIGSIGALSALFGLLAWEHAHVQAGQSVPLA
jgi:hypothetical protein